MAPRYGLGVNPLEMVKTFVPNFVGNLVHINVCIRSEVLTQTVHWFRLFLTLALDIRLREELGPQNALRSGIGSTGSRDLHIYPKEIQSEDRTPGFNLLRIASQVTGIHRQISIIWNFLQDDEHWLNSNLLPLYLQIRTPFTSSCSSIKST